jgi:hypothetical protein
MQLKKALNDLLSIKNFKVVYNPNQRKAYPQTVLIGLGNITEEDGGICLNQKGTSYHSVSELIYHASDTTVSRWRTLFPDDSSLEQGIYYMEDLSPDTCFSFILFYCRVQGVPVEEIPLEWI